MEFFRSAFARPASVSDKLQGLRLWGLCLARSITEQQTDDQPQKLDSTGFAERAIDSALRLLKQQVLLWRQKDPTSFAIDPEQSKVFFEYLERIQKAAEGARLQGP